MVSVNAQDAKPIDSVFALEMCNGVISDECVVRYFKDSQEASVIRGRLVFQNY